MAKTWKKDLKEMMSFDYQIKEVHSKFSLSGKRLFYFVVYRRSSDGRWYFGAHSKDVGYRTALKFAEFHHDVCAIRDIKELRSLDND